MLKEGPTRSPTVKQMRAEEESMGGIFRTDKINRILKIAWQLDGEREIKMFKREHLCIFILYLYKMSVWRILIDLGVEFLSKRVCRFGCCLFIVKPAVVFSLSLFTFLFSSIFSPLSLKMCLAELMRNFGARTEAFRSCMKGNGRAGIINADRNERLPCKVPQSLPFDQNILLRTRHTCQWAPHTNTQQKWPLRNITFIQKLIFLSNVTWVVWEYFILY